MTGAEAGGPGPNAPASAPRHATRILRAAGAFLLRLPLVAAGALVAAWGSLIWSLSSRRVPVPASDTFWGEWLSNLAHAPLFGLLGLWTGAIVLRRELVGGRGWPRVAPASAVALLLLVGAFGALDEWHQSRVPGRDASALDVLTDLVGVSMVLWVTAYLGRPGAADRGLWRRLALASLACLASAAIATLG